MNIYEDLKMHLRAAAFHDESICCLSDAEVLLVLAIIQECENMYTIVKSLKHVITDLENKIKMLEDDPVPEDDVEE